MEDRAGHLALSDGHLEDPRGRIPCSLAALELSSRLERVAPDHQGVLFRQYVMESLLKTSQATPLMIGRRAETPEPTKRNWTQLDTMCPVKV